MVQVVRGEDTRRGLAAHMDDPTHASFNPGTPEGQGTPLIHVHYVRRDVHGNGLGIKVYGELKIAAKEVVYARELKLNTLQVLLLTIEQGTHYNFNPTKYISQKGQYENYASIDIFGVASYEMLTSGQTATDTLPTYLPYDGSIWLNFLALGE